MNNLVKHLIAVTIGIVIFDVGRNVGYSICKQKTIVMLMEEASKEKPVKKDKLIKKVKAIK